MTTLTEQEYKNWTGQQHQDWINSLAIDDKVLVSVKRSVVIHKVTSNTAKMIETANSGKRLKSNIGMWDIRPITVDFERKEILSKKRHELFNFSVKINRWSFIDSLKEDDIDKLIAVMSEVCKEVCDAN